ncbi:hypothetical protein [Polaribacter uvawellassae]|uniref:hypothetical protein n=1 Tax=Polaribacter uvawellassae TaxID=3133495 RepID=UPI00321C1A99
MKKNLFVFFTFCFIFLSYSQKAKQIDYSFINSNKDFIKTFGDFFNVKYNESDYNIMVRYFPETIYHGKNVVEVWIRTSKTSKESIKKQKIKVHSDKLGRFYKSKKVHDLKEFPQVLFYKKMRFKNLNKLLNDTITVSINKKKYLFFF